MIVFHTIVQVDANHLVDEIDGNIPVCHIWCLFTPQTANALLIRSQVRRKLDASWAQVGRKLGAKMFKNADVLLDGKPSC